MGRPNWPSEPSISSLSTCHTVEALTVGTICSHIEAILTPRSRLWRELPKSLDDLSLPVGPDLLLLTFPYAHLSQ
jgi:hypothetical protein